MNASESKTAADKHTVLVVDDHPLFRRGVRELLSLDDTISWARPEPAMRRFCWRGS